MIKYKLSRSYSILYNNYCTNTNKSVHMQSQLEVILSANSPQVLPVAKDHTTKVARTLPSLHIVSQPYPEVAYVRILAFGATPHNSIVLLQKRHGQLRGIKAAIQ